MNHPAVSIVLPIYNQHDYLPKCLDSIINQSLREIEIICVNDGSTDDSLDIIRRYAEKDPRMVIIDKPNTGYGDSLNIGIDRSTGEYLGIVEPDDFIECYMMEYLYDKAKSHDLDWIKGDVYFYYNDGRNESRHVESITYGMEIYDIVLDPRTDVRPHRSAVRTWAGIYKSIFVKANGIGCNCTPGASYQDVGFFLRSLYFARRVMFVNTPFYNWRQDNPRSSINYGLTQSMELTVREFELDQDYLDSHPELCRFAVNSFHYLKFQSYGYLGLKLKGQEKKELLSRLREELSDARSEKRINRRFFTNIEWFLFKSLLINVDLYMILGLTFVGLKDMKQHGVRHAFGLGWGWVLKLVR